MIFTRNFAPPALCQKEILRYAGCRTPDPATEELLSSCLEEAMCQLTYGVCWGEFPVKISGSLCQIGEISVTSGHLAKNLTDCDAAVVFAATVGPRLDRLIGKYSSLSPARALMLQAIGAERIEALCDAFCRSLREEKSIGTKPRFSPGYGDLPLQAQQDIFSLLSPHRHIGLTLTQSLLMSPSKSVTAFVGLTKQETPTHTGGCSLCDKKDCQFRGAL